MIQPSPGTNVIEGLRHARTIVPKRAEPFRRGFEAFTRQATGMHPIKSTAKSVLEGLGAHWLGRSLYKHCALILMYHGLTPAKTSPDWGQVPADKFEAQMHYLNSHYNVVTLARLLEMMASRRVEPYTATVTFDEGYGSTNKVAYPILKKLGIPATVYLTTGFITPQHDPVRYIWSDYISVLLTSSGESKLDLRPWGSEEFDISDATRLYRARRRISIHLKALRTEDKDGVLKALEDRYADRIDHAQFTDYHPMTWEEVGTLQREGLVGFGAHTRTHPILSRLDDRHLEDEMLGSRDDIRSRLGTAVDDFAFPSGRRVDISPAALALARREFKSAATTVSRLNRLGQDPHFLYRIGIGNDLQLPRFKVLISGMYSFDK